jgi:transcriptional regulator with XRE-family HTH domain
MNKKDISPEPGKRIRFLREKLGLTRAQFSKETGISANTLRAIEVGEMKLARSRATTISHMFILLYELDPQEASVDVLLCGQENKKKKQSKKQPLKTEVNPLS